LQQQGGKTMDLKQAEITLRRSARPLDLCSVSEAAARARLNPFTVWKWIREGHIKAYGRPGSLRVSVADLLPEFQPKGDQGR
jgi:hypothetical protein